MRRTLLLLPSIALLFSGCISPADLSNVDPRIDAIHVKAFDYDMGTGGKPKDRVKANQLYLEAARAGHPTSMLNYAINRFNGEGCKADHVDAYQWIDMARFATQGSKDMELKYNVRGAQKWMLQNMTAAEKQRAGGYQGKF